MLKDTLLSIMFEKYEIIWKVCVNMLDGNNDSKWYMINEQPTKESAVKSF